MKFLFALTVFLASSSALAATGAVPEMLEISANSPLGQNLLSHARRLDQNEQDQSWISGYSIKFQGCSAIKQWNAEADGDNDVKIETKNLVRFRLCPSDSCSTKSVGCTAGYGDYVISMDTFMDSYFESVRQNSEYECEQFLNDKCDCNEENGDKDDNFNADYCEYDCFNDNGMAQCIDRNPYQEDGEADGEFNVEEYMECRELNIENNRRRRRRADEAEAEGDAEEADGEEQQQEQQQEEEEDVQYFVGPYCAYEGGEIFLGLFTDDTCTTTASNGLFKTLMGFDLPYEKTSLVSTTCVSCLEPQENNNGGDDADDADAVSEGCENIYLSSGKCESTLPEGMVASPNTAACTYMQGITIVRKDGIIDVGTARKSAVATSFIVIFAMAFCAMAFYVWYLRTRLGVKKDTLL